MTTNTASIHCLPSPPYESQAGITSMKRWRSELPPVDPSGSFDGVQSTDQVIEDAFSHRSSHFVKLSRASDSVRRDLAVALVQAASDCRAPLNDMEDLMLTMSRSFATEVTLIRIKKTITCLVGSRTAGWELKMKVLEDTEGPCNKERLHGVRAVLDAVSAEQITIADAIDELAEIIHAQEEDVPCTFEYSSAHLVVAGVVSGAVHRTFEGGSTKGAYISALAAVLLCIIHIMLYQHKRRYARALQLFVVVITSLIAHSSIGSPHASTVVSILPGYMYMCNLLSRFNKDFPSEWARTAMWASYAIMLGLGLHVLFDVVLMTSIVGVEVSRDTYNKVHYPSQRPSGVSSERTLLYQVAHVIVKGPE
ncbi:hypothetical protein BDW22DRAFT_1424100 [Trametopsis cervina]|nr:hypothetical protein BDW22DRAFT_1424100 [Trametopsis cervina]